MATDQQDKAVFARHPYGKCDDAIRVRMPFALKQKVENLAHTLGTDASDFIRDLIYVRIDGIEHAQTLAAARLQAVAGVLANPLHEGETDGGPT